MVRLFKFLVLILLMTSCQTGDDVLHRKLSKGDSRAKVYHGHFKESRHKEKSFSEIGMASWYGKKQFFSKGLHGKKTANGDTFNTDMLTAAHKTLPIPSIARITNLSNNKSVLVLINDRGPYHKKRVVDVSSKVASVLDFKLKGVAKVKIEAMESETLELLDKLRLDQKPGSKPKGKMKNPKCSVNCFVKLLNIKHGYQTD